MGFCIAEMGLDLAIPKDPAAFVKGWPGLVAFAISFLFISILWWYHRKLFTTYFVLNPVTLVLNFVMLGGLALAVYFQQVFAQFVIGGMDAQWPQACWTGSLAIVYAIVAVQYSIGIAYKRSILSESDLNYGITRAFRSAVVAVLMATVAVASLTFGHLTTVLYAIAAAGVILGIVRRIYVPKIAAALLAGRGQRIPQH
jgi:uncharacterized membrane protein